MPIVEYTKDNLTPEAIERLVASIQRPLKETQDEIISLCSKMNQDSTESDFERLYVLFDEWYHNKCIKEDCEEFDRSQGRL
jgi:hypothetical protein